MSRRLRPRGFGLFADHGGKLLEEFGDQFLAAASIKRAVKLREAPDESFAQEPITIRQAGIRKVTFSAKGVAAHVCGLSDHVRAGFTKPTSYHFCL